jgi:IclR family KDG regulon transcriptional repressor
MWNNSKAMDTLEKAFGIIEDIVANQQGGLLFSEIALRLDLPKSSTHRILNRLVRMGYLLFDQNTKRYRGSLRLSKLGAAVIECSDLRDLIIPFLQRLHQETGHICNLGIMSEGRGIFLHKIEPKSYPIRLYSEIGKEFPLHCTGMGKILLAFMEPEQSGKFLSGPLASYTETTITDAKALLQELREVKRCGYAVDREEITRGIMCVAAPVRDMNKEVIGSISVTFPSYLEKERGLTREIEAVKSCSKEIYRAMGGR